MTRLAVALTTLLGTLVVARSAAFYRGEDALALAVLGAVAVGLWFGAFELWRRATTAEALLREVRGLPREVDEAALANASRGVRAFAAAMRAGQSAPGGPVGFTPYLVGLLVMLGLFGTFLGLVETLAGARGAMVAAADVQALRQGLAGPIDGLTRAFGTSVAGVAASAALGLAAVWVRRAERRARTGLADWAARTLSHTTPAGRQLAALEALTRQGDALPAAADALGRAVERIERLEAALLTSQTTIGDRAAGAYEAAAKAAAEAFSTAASEIEGQLIVGFDGAVERTSAAIAEMAATTAERAEAAVGRHAAEWTTRLDADADARRVADAAHLTATRAAIDGAGETLREEVRAMAAGMAADESMRREAQAAGFETITRAIEQIELERAAAEETRAEALDTHAAALAERLNGVEERRRRDLADAIERLDTRLTTADAERAAGWTALAEQVEQRGVAVVDRVEQAAETDRRARAEADTVNAARYERLLSRVDDAETARAEAWSVAASRLAERHGTLLDEMGRRDTARIAGDDARHGALLERLDDTARSRAEADAMLVAHVEALLETVDGAERRRASEADARSTAVHGRHADLLDRLDTLARRQAEADTQLRAHMESSHGALLAQIEAAEGRRDAARAEAWSRTLDRVEAADSRRQDEAEAAMTRQTEALAGFAIRMDAADARRAEALSAAADTQRRAIEALAARLAESDTRRAEKTEAETAIRVEALAALGERMTRERVAADAAQQTALSGLAGRMEALEGARVERAEAEAATQLAAIAALADRLEAAEQVRTALAEATAGTQLAAFSSLAERLEGIEQTRTARADAAAGTQLAAFEALAERLEGVEQTRTARAETTADTQLAAIATLAGRIESVDETRAERSEAVAAAQLAAIAALAARLEGVDETRAERARIDGEQQHAAIAALAGRMETLDRARTERAAHDAEQQRAALTEVVERIESGARNRVEAMVERLDTAVDATREGLLAIRAPLGTLVDDVRRSTERLAEAEQARVDALAERLDTLVARVQNRLTETAEADAARLAAFAESVATARTHLEDAAVRSAEQASSIGARFEAVQAALADLDVQTAERLEATTVRLGSALAAQAEAFASAQSARATEAAAVLLRLDNALEEHLGAMGERLSGPLAKVAEQAAEAPAAAAALVERAAATMTDAQARDDARNARLDAIIGGMADAVERMDAAAETRLVAAEAAEEASTARLVELSAAVEAALSTQAERLAHFETRVVELNREATSALAERLGAQAAELGRTLGATGDVVRSGAQLLQAGGIELSAVAQMLAEAVDSYRESNDRWLTTLAELESTLGGGGEDQAGRLVGEYLDQTREIFGDALRFQRELFTELRALRGEAPGVSPG